MCLNKELGGRMGYAIQNMENEHLGFLLMAEENSSGDCIFRSLPNKPEIFETEVSNILSELQELGEFQYIYVDKELSINHTALTEPIVIKEGFFNLNGQQFKVIEMGNS